MAVPSERDLIEWERKLDACTEAVALAGERCRALVVVARSDRSDHAAETARIAGALDRLTAEVAGMRADVADLRTSTARLVAQHDAPSGFWASVFALIRAGGWPAVGLLVSPLIAVFAGVVLWQALSTGVPILDLISALAGGHHGAP